MAEPPTPQQLTQIRDRAERLAAIPLQTRDGDNCIVADLIASAGDVQQLLAAVDAIGKTEVEWGYWHEDEFIISELQFSAGDVRYYQERSGRPVERRVAGEWREVPGA